MKRPCLLAVMALLLAAVPAQAQDVWPDYDDDAPAETVVTLPTDDYPALPDTGGDDQPIADDQTAPDTGQTDDQGTDRWGADVSEGGRGEDERVVRKTNKKAISASPRITGPTVPGTKAVKRSDGTAVPPSAAPLAVKKMIWTANRLIGRRYRYGGGHVSFADSSYDCSGAVSYALHAAGLLSYPKVSGDLARSYRPGNGRWVTIYAHSGHVYMTIAGLRLDTSAVNDPGGLGGPRWRPLYRDSRGFHKRHPAGL